MKCQVHGRHLNIFGWNNGFMNTSWELQKQNDYKAIIAVYGETQKKCPHFHTILLELVYMFTSILFIFLTKNWKMSYS